MTTIRDYEHGIERDGLIRKMPEEVYHLGGGEAEVGFHVAMELDRAPAVARYALDNPQYTDSPSKQFGRCMHIAILEPDELDERVVAMPEGKKRQGKWWDEFKAEHEGKEIIKPHQMDAILDIADKVRANRHAQFLANEDTEKELSGFWTDPETGLRCRMRVDAWCKSHNFLLDVKSAADASIRALERACANYHYPGQQAWYMDGAEQLGMEAEDFIFLFIESDWPHLYRFATIEEEYVFRAGVRNRRARRLWQSCVDKADWPGYTQDIIRLALPPWADEEGE